MGKMGRSVEDELERLGDTLDSSHTKIRFLNSNIIIICILTVGFGWFPKQKFSQAMHIFSICWFYLFIFSFFIYFIFSTHPLDLSLPRAGYCKSNATVIQLIYLKCSFMPCRILVHSSKVNAKGHGSKAFVFALTPRIFFALCTLPPACLSICLLLTHAAMQCN